MEKLFMSSDLPAAALGQDVSQAPVHAEQQGWCSHPNTPDGRAESTGHSVILPRQVSVSCHRQFSLAQRNLLLKL